MSEQEVPKIHTCSHDISLGIYCWMCDYENRAIASGKSISVQKSVTPKSSLKSIEETKEIPEQMSFDIIKDDHLSFTKFSPKGPVPKSSMPSFTKARDDQKDHIFYITPKAVSFNLEGYAVIPLEDWNELNHPFFYFLIKVKNFFKGILEFEKLG